MVAWPACSPAAGCAVPPAVRPLAPPGLPSFCRLPFVPFESKTISPTSASVPLPKCSGRSCRRLRDPRVSSACEVDFRFITLQRAGFNGPHSTRESGALPCSIENKIATEPDGQLLSRRSSAARRLAGCSCFVSNGLPFISVNFACWSFVRTSVLLAVVRHCNSAIFAIASVLRRPREGLAILPQKSFDRLRSCPVWSFERPRSLTTSASSSGGGPAA